MSSQLSLLVVACLLAGCRGCGSTSSMAASVAPPQQEEAPERIPDEEVARDEQQLFSFNSTSMHLFDVELTSGRATAFPDDHRPRDHDGNRGCPSERTYDVGHTYDNFPNGKPFFACIVDPNRLLVVHEDFVEMFDMQTGQALWGPLRGQGRVVSYWLDLPNRLLVRTSLHQYVLELRNGRILWSTMMEKGSPGLILSGDLALSVTIRKRGRSGRPVGDPLYPDDDSHGGDGVFLPKLRDERPVRAGAFLVERDAQSGTVVKTIPITDIPMYANWVDFNLEPITSTHVRAVGEFVAWVY